MSTNTPFEIHVATDGNDTNSGSADDPLATLAAARDASRREKPSGDSLVNIHSGDYLLTETFELTAEDSAPAGGISRPVGT